MVSQKQRVLFVDDDVDMAELYRIHGDAAGFDTKVCTSGGDALKFLEGNAVDLVVLDLAMPVMDGLRTAKEIRKNENNHPERRPVDIVFLTAYDSTDTIESVKEKVGATRIFRKPMDLNRFMTEVSKPPKTEIQRGSASPNFILILVAVVAQITVASLFLWLLNRQDVAAAYQFTLMKSDRDQIKRICDSNALLDYQKEKWIEQNRLTLPAQMSGQTPCQTTGEK